MADDARSELARAARKFSYVGASPAGREIRLPDSNPAAPGPFERESIYGLADLYARARPDVWPTPLTAAPSPATQAPGWAFGREPDYDRRQTFGPEGAALGGWPPVQPAAAVPSPDPNSGLGSDTEVVWHTLAGAAGGTIVMAAALAFMKKHKLATALWSLALIAWMLPAPY